MTVRATRRRRYPEGPTQKQVERALDRQSRLADYVAGGKRPAQICLHEAAHAVVAHELGREVIGISFNRRGAMAGYRGSLRADPLEEGMIAMAGHAAEVLWRRQPVWAAPRDDDRAVRALGFRGRSFPTLLALAQGQCVQLEPQIRAVAAALKRGDLDRKAFLRALRTAARAPSGVDALVTAAMLAEGKPDRKGARSRG